MSLFSGLNPHEPRDNELVANLPKHIRDTRRSIGLLKVLNVKLEAGVERGDIVLYETHSDTWIRSTILTPQRSMMHGVAFPEDSAVVVGASSFCPDWNWTPGQLLYMSEEYGKMQHEPTSLVCGVAVTRKLVLFNIFGMEGYRLLGEMQQIKIEVTHIYELILKSLESLEGTLDEIEKAKQDAIDAINAIVDDLKGLLDIYGPLFDEATHIYTSIKSFDFKTATDYTDGRYTVPSYTPKYTLPMVSVNGVEINNYEMVGDVEKESTTIRIFEPIPLGTRVSGLLIGLPRIQKIPTYVEHDDSLEGTGRIDDPLRVVSYVMEGIDIANTRTFVQDVQTSVDMQGVTLRLLLQGVLRNAASTQFEALPKASQVQAGTIDAAAYATIFENQADIAALQGIDFEYAVNLGATQVTDQAVLQSAYIQASGEPAGTKATTGTSLLNLDEYNGMGGKYTWFDNRNMWVYRGQATVSIASSSLLGIVKGETTTKGKIFVEIDGTMSVIGYDDIMTAIQNLQTGIGNIAGVRRYTMEGTIALPYTRNTAITVPTYVMGKKALHVYVGGVRIINFAERTTTAISLNDNISVTDTAAPTARIVVDAFVV